MMAHSKLVVFDATKISATTQRYGGIPGGWVSLRIETTGEVVDVELHSADEAGYDNIRWLAEKIEREAKAASAAPAGFALPLHPELPY